MDLQAIYFSNDMKSRFIVVDDGEEDQTPYIIINGTLVSSQELDKIITWCDDRNHDFYSIGIVQFTNRNDLLEFLLRWG